MRSREMMKEEMSEMTLDELHRYKDVLLRNQKMGVTHLDDMGLNDLQIEIVNELIHESINPRWSYSG